MINSELVRYHVRCAVRAGMAEASGFKELADRLRAQGNLRLMIMSDDELRELSRILTHIPTRPTEVVYQELKQVVDEQSKACDEWLSALGV